MLTLNDGRSELWQWDTGRTLAVDVDCSQVHFSNKVFGRSIDVDVIDGVAIIPDILLQTDKNLNVWAFVGTAENGYTKISKTFKVNRRNKPADYVFTAVEQTTIFEIAEIAQSVRDDADAGLFDGITPHIGDNGNWYLGDTDTGKPSRGEKGDTGEKGDKGDAGATGLQGPKGDTGETGPAGAGVPDGGTAGQLLSKTESGTEWINPPQSGVQPDWNQNDSTAADYVKNRPFYAGDPVETVLVEESTVSFAANRPGVYMGKLESTFSATVGETYKVSWDGAVYESACVDFNGMTLIGNLALMAPESDTGEPFVMNVKNGERIHIATADTSASHTISISGYIGSVVKINPKYLPMASKTEPGIIAFDNLDNYVLSLVKEEYFNPIDFQISGYGDANTIEECANRNNSYGIIMPGKLSGAVLSYYRDSENKYITSVLSGGEHINCYKFSMGSLNAEQLWGISKDGVVISSSTPNSTKKFKITVDDSGTLKATEVT